MEPRVRPMPGRRGERERVLPPLLVHVGGHVDVPGLPGPGPAGVGELGIGDVHGAIAQVAGDPGAGVEVEEGAVGVKGDAEEEPAALVFVEDVEFADGLYVVFRGVSSIRVPVGTAIGISIIPITRRRVHRIPSIPRW